MSKIWTADEIGKFEKEFGVECTLRPDGMYDVAGDVYLHNNINTNNAKSLLDVLPPIWNLHGELRLRRTIFKDLKGSPRHILASLDCEYNSLKTLEGAPLYICNYFDCQSNPDLRFTQSELDAMNIQTYTWWDPDQLIIQDPCEFIKELPV